MKNSSKAAQKRKGAHPKGVQPEHLKKHAFPKGVSGNPDGARKHSPEKREFKKLTEAELKEIQNVLIHGSLEELQAVLKDPDASVMKLMTAKVAVNILKSGNAAAWETFLTRLIGKPKVNVQLDGDVHAKLIGQVVVQMPSNGREAS